MMQKIQTEKAPHAIGPYSQAIDSGDYIFCSGQIGIDPENGNLVEGIENQTKQVMENLKAVLSAGGCDFSNAVKVDIFITNIADFPKVNEIYESYLKEPLPARATVEVSNLPKGALIEIACIAKSE
jgi:2-iminobutanoate/2-iminopropanoate deaminase